jgi:DNA-binding NarL/FixJ family response regulator
MIVDNDSGQVETIKGALSHQEDFEIISVVTTREAAIKQITVGPDIVMLNPEVLKQRTLSRFIHSLQAKSPSARVMSVLKEPPTDENAIADIKAGIRGYFKIGDPPSIISKAVRSVHEGEIWAERRILEKAIAKPMLLPETLQAHVPGLPPLTNREMEMLTMVLQGATNKEIADSSRISERTVKTHLYRVYRKLKVKSRTKAIALLSHA